MASPGSGRGPGPAAAAAGGTNRSAGRFPDGADTDSNCDDFLLQSASTLSAAAPAGAQVSGSGITLTAPLAKAHAGGAQVASSVPTPGAPNQYERSRRNR